MKIEISEQYVGLLHEKTTNLWRENCENEEITSIQR